ncbi:MAG: EAL domain-containing protein [Gammaproteobacteria bacterium]|nr:EAL domain-containing protein [Gammaproteobacteria bacterium]
MSFVALAIPAELYASVESSNTVSSGAFTFLALVQLVIVVALSSYIFYLKRVKSIHPLSQVKNNDKWLNAFEFYDEPIFLVDLDDRVLQANQAFYKKINKKPTEVLGTKVTQYFHPEGEQTPCPICRARKERRNELITLDVDDPQNHTCMDIEVRVRVVTDDAGKPVGVLQHIHDISLSKKIEAQLRKGETKFRTLLESTPDAMVITDTEGTIVLANKQCKKVMGYSPEELVGQKIEILLPDSIKHSHIGMRDAFSKRPVARPLGKADNLYARHKDGNIIPVEVSLSPWNDEEEVLICSVVRDISQRKHDERELKRLASFLQRSPTPTFELNEIGLVSFMNPKAVELFPELSNSDSFHPLLQGIDTLQKIARGTGEVKTRIVELKGYVFEQQVSYIPELDIFHIYLWDITVRQRDAEKMEYQASHDSLTGLINRMEFEDRIKHAIRDARVENKTHVFCYIDLDRFKIVNDQCGHVAGDALLQQLSQILKSKIRDSDTLARLGGDEFGLLLTGCNEKRGLQMSENLKDVISNYRFIYDNKSYSVGASIGLMTLDKNSEGLKEVMQSADSACYMAKEKGRNRVHVFHPDDKELHEQADKTEWAQRILEGLEQNSFVLYQQSIHPITGSNEIINELLIRMLDKNGDIILPGVFLPAAERYYLMNSIDKWVVNYAFEQISKNQLDRGIYSINISGDSLSDVTMLNYVIDMLDEHAIDATKICFEITETAVAHNLSQTQKFLSTLKGLGCQFALDDFGSGVSSFVYLQSLAVDILKIDGRLVRGIEHNKTNLNMVRSITEIGHSLGMKVIAEFVENENVLAELEKIHVDYGQGYFFSRPKALGGGDSNKTMKAS